MSIISKRKITIDVMYNIIAQAIPITILQLLVFPLVGAQLSQDEYGMMIMLYSLSTVIGNVTGNSLNNSRLLYDGLKVNLDAKGNFNVILIAFGFVSLMLCFILNSILDVHFALSRLLILILLSLLITVSSYLIVYFRMVINYKNILATSIILAIGYCLGFLIYIYTKKWEAVLFSGEITRFIYLVYKTPLLREGLGLTSELRSLSTNAIILFLSAIPRSFITYADRLLLFPLLGAESVTILYIATLVGKMIAMIIGPIRGVILTYIVRIDYFNRRAFFKLFVITFMITCGLYIIAYAISKPIIYLLYPQWLEIVLPMVPLATGIACLGYLVTMVSPFTLRFCPISWQISLNYLVIAAYIFIAIALMASRGIYGFCIGIMISEVLDLGFNLILIYHYLGKENSIVEIGE